MERGGGEVMGEDEEVVEVEMGRVCHKSNTLGGQDAVRLSPGVCAGHTRV